MTNIIIKHGYHKISESEREYGYECENCGTVIIATRDEFRGDFIFTRCPNCSKSTLFIECTGLRNKKEVDQFIRLHIKQ